MTLRQKKVAECLTDFIDRTYFPDYQPTADDWELFFHVETAGKRGTPLSELDRIKPLLEAKGDYDLQIKNIHQEVSEWWSKGRGWSYPLDAAIATATGIYKQALEKIRENFKMDSLGAVIAYTGFSKEERDKYLIAYEQSCQEQINLCHR